MVIAWSIASSLKKIAIKINKPNKALQLTPSRTALSYDRPVFPFTSFPELVRPFGVAELAMDH